MWRGGGHTKIRRGGKIDMLTKLDNLQPQNFLKTEQNNLNHIKLFLLSVKVFFRQIWMSGKYIKMC